MSPGGRHGHKIREYQRRIDAVLEEDRMRRRPPPPPISAEHAALRNRIERDLAALYEQLPEGIDDIAEGVLVNPELAASAAHLGGLMREEEEFLIGQGVDPRPWDW